MAGAERNVKSVDMASTNTSYQIHSEASASHWVAWITKDGGTKPYQSVVLIGASQAEAEARAGAWADRALARAQQ
jgi:hypothetical protein